MRCDTRLGQRLLQIFKALEAMYPAIGDFEQAGQVGFCAIPIGAGPNSMLVRDQDLAVNVDFSGLEPQARPLQPNLQQCMSLASAARTHDLDLRIRKATQTFKIPCIHGLEPGLYSLSQSGFPSHSFTRPWLPQ
ncbi:MAG TPA: hypothetical protein V6D23_04330 [Candidatus Obscuribacterales bacterium]